MGTGSSKNDNVVAFDVENVAKDKKQNDQNGNKPSSWQEDVKKEQKSRSRLGVIFLEAISSREHIVGNLEVLNSLNNWHYSQNL